jgi:hypothetical protein
LETSKEPIEEKTWVREMPLGASHTLTLLNLTLGTRPQEESLEISKVPTEEKIWAREMPLGANHTLILFK